MRPSIARCVCLLSLAVVILLLVVSPLFAQQQPANQKAGESKAPVLQYVIALLCALVVMLIICAPSRKSQPSSPDED